MEFVLFVVGAAAAVIGALGVVGGIPKVLVVRNPVHSALMLLLTMVAMALFFLMQDADLVAIIQIVVYASAIVVLFIFVITLLGVDRHEALDEPRRFQRPLAIVLGALALAQVLYITRDNWTTGRPSTLRALDDDDRGNVRNVAEALFTDYFWAFEITAVLLVVAVVGGVVVARRHRALADRPGEPS